MGANIIMPQLGETVAEGKIVSWFKQTGDVVKEGQKVWVKLLGFDERGKVRLSMRIVDQTTGKEVVEKKNEGGEAAE